MDIFIKRILCTRADGNVKILKCRINNIMKKISTSMKVSSSGVRLDVFVRDSVPGLSRSIIKKAIEKGLITVNGKKVPKGFILNRGDVVEINDLPLPETITPEPDETLNLKVYFQDHYFVAVEKPCGVPTLPLRWDEKGTVANYLARHYPEVMEVGRKGLEGGILHRLDVDTSGFILVARREEAFQKFHKWQREGKVRKKFLALVKGDLNDEVTIRVPVMFLHGREKKVYTSVPSSFSAKPRKVYPAVTHVIPLERKGENTLVIAEVCRAVRHQIRTHLANIGHPVVGDSIYGVSQKSREERMFHLHLLEMQVPSAGDPAETIIIRSDVPGWAGT